MGTAAHAFTLLHDSEEQAFRAQVEALGSGTTLLVDTYDVRQGVETAVRVAGTELGAVRLDSGDLPSLVAEVRAQLDGLGATGTRITVTNDLDESTIGALRAAPVDSYGVGTSLVTGSGAPTAGMVYKLVAHENADGAWVPVAKRSAAKASVGGRKRAWRQTDARGTAIAEIVRTRGLPPERARELLVPLVVDGSVEERWTGPAGVAEARTHHAYAMSELPREALRIGRSDEAGIPTLID
jgi:nicotinate phosphoribosyltransferase